MPACHSEPIRKENDGELLSRVQEDRFLHQSSSKRPKSHNGVACVWRVVGSGATERLAVAARAQSSDLHGGAAVGLQNTCPLL